MPRAAKNMPGKDWPAVSAREKKVLSLFRWRYSDLKKGWKLLVSIFLAQFWCSTQLMCVKPWQTTNHILTQVGAKLALVLACEVAMEAAGGGECWEQPRAGERESQQAGAELQGPAPSAAQGESKSLIPRWKRPNNVATSLRSASAFTVQSVAV